MTDQPVLRWRALTPAQASEVRRLYESGVSARQLATGYGVHIRTIYRTLHRQSEAAYDVEVGGFRATFQMEAGRPVQVTPWVPA